MFVYVVIQFLPWFKFCSPLYKFAYKTLNLMQNDMCASSDKNTNSNISKNCYLKSGFQILHAVEQFSSLFSKDKLKARGTHTPTHDPSSRTCRGRTAVRFPANSSHMCCVELALKAVLCTCLGGKGSFRHGFSPFIDLMALSC